VSALLGCDTNNTDTLNACHAFHPDDPRVIISQISPRSLRLRHKSPKYAQKLTHLALALIELMCYNMGTISFLVCTQREAYCTLTNGGWRKAAMPSRHPEQPIKRGYT
jgi:hypothetical protein